MTPRSKVCVKRQKSPHRYIREKFTRDLSFARQMAREYSGITRRTGMTPRSRAGDRSIPKY